MNFLILSCGTRNKVIQYFRRAFEGRGRIIATDMSRLAPAVYEADQFYITPQMDAPDYLDFILNICRREKIAGVMSLIDPELSILAANKSLFEAVGTRVIGSSYELCEMALDKYCMYQWLKEHGYHCAKSYVDKERFYWDIEEGRITYPVFVKPAKGSASIAVTKAFDKETIELLFSREEGLMVQEFLQGQEIGADIYIDMLSGEIVSIFAKKKLKMRAGETDKAVSFKNRKLFGILEKFVKEAGFQGVIDVDIFEVDGEYYISEVNPRFGGGYPHAYECGCDFMGMILENLSGCENRKRVGEYNKGVYMMKYNEVRVGGISDGVLC